MNTKILKNPYFYSAKMAPKKVDNLLTFKGANPLTLWRPKCGQPSASPAYIYIYICLRVRNWTPAAAFQESLIEPPFSEAFKTL